MEEDRTCFWLFLILVLNQINQAILQQPNINGTYNATESIEATPPVGSTRSSETSTSVYASEIIESSSSLATTKNPDFPSSVNLLQSSDSEIPSGPNKSLEDAGLQQPNINGTYNGTESIEISPSDVSSRRPDTLDSKTALGPGRNSEPAILLHLHVNRTYNATESIEISPSDISSRRSATLESKIPSGLNRNFESAILQQPIVNGTYNTTKSIRISPSIKSSQRPLDSEILTDDGRSLEILVLQEPDINETYNTSESIDITFPVASSQRPDTLNSEISPDVVRSIEPAILQQPNVNGTYNTSESIDISSPVISATSTDSQTIIISLTPKYLDLEIVPRVRRSLESDVSEELNVNGTHNATENIDISSPVAIEKNPETPDLIISLPPKYLDLEKVPRLRRALEPDVLEELNINGTYNATESNEISSPVVSEKTSDTPNLIMTLTPKYLDLEKVSRLRRSLEPDVLEESNVDEIYNATEGIEISSSEATLNVPDSPKLLNSLSSQDLDSEIFPGLHRSFEVKSENYKNLESVQPLEKYLQPLEINITSNVPREDDLHEYNPVSKSFTDLSSEKIGSRSGDLKSNDLSVVPMLRNQTSSKLPLNENANAMNSQDKFRTPSPPVTSIPEPKTPEWPFQNSFRVHVPIMMNQTERIMVLAPQKEQALLWNANSVHSRLEQMRLKKWTEDYVLHLHRKYQYMPIIDADNRLWSKYSRAVAESFVLAFYRAYLQDPSFSQGAIAEYYDVKYNKSFDAAVSYLQRRKAQTALQFAAQPRRYSDILVAIIDTPMDIVQSLCSPAMASWMCDAKYLTHLMDVSDNCSTIWLHALVHLDTIEANAQKNPADIIVDELESRIPMQPSNEVNLLFDFIVNTIEELRVQLKQSLIINAKLYRDIKDLQEKDLLQCLNVS